MGLVSTWLNGIGLNSVAPTFEAAGIVTPTHLAELDVSYFESLGVTDPDDRRKLFYLVQRIKMAVNRKSPKKGDSVEERVDAIVSESFSAHSSAKNTASNIERTDVAESVQDVTSEETKTTDLLKTDSEPRRSRRLASKTLKENHPAESDNSVETARTGTVFVKSVSTSRRSSSTTSEEAHTSSPPKSPIRRPVFASNTARENLVDGPTKPLQQAMVSEPINLPKPKPDNEMDVFNLQGESRREKGVEIESHPTFVATLSEPDAVIQESLPILVKKNHHSRRPESRLPGSLRTGKGLSVIPSETTAPLSPLGVFSSSALNDEIEKRDIRKGHPNRTKRISSSSSSRRTTLSVDSDSLEELLQSSMSESSEHSRVLIASDADSDDEGGSKISRQGLNKSRAKSMSVSDLLPLQLQHSQLKRSSTSTSNRNSRPSLSDRRPVSSAMGGADSSIAGHSKHSMTAGSRGSAPIVLGTSESETWATKIGYLREDNHAEHELFRELVDSPEQEYYDMRIKVIIRKRPLSKSEANLTGGGVDIIHPLDYGEYGRILLYQPRTRVDLTREVETVPFAYDNVFDESSTNLQIYERSLRNLIGPLFEGQWATCFAYGQTGSG